MDQETHPTNPTYDDPMPTARGTPSRHSRRRPVAAGVLLVTAIIVRFGNDAFIALESRAPSESRGTAAHGSLVHGRRLPSSGPNFRAYSYLGALLGRNSVHERVRASVLDAYASMRTERPSVTFVYGETSWPSGGTLWPHHTHQNGLAVDFLSPLVDGAGESVAPSTWPWNAWGYARHFDDRGSNGNVTIDFATIGAHLVALDRATRAHGVVIARVIFDPELQRVLAETTEGRRALASLPFMRERAWVRHDQHYHVDFALR
jgi:penicillin-insensitive murein endopeptidase